MKIYNQFTETFSVNDLALKVKNAANKIGINVSINKKKIHEKKWKNITIILKIQP